MEALERETGRKKLTGEEEEGAEKHYPVAALTRTHITGGLTMIVQGALRNEKVFGGDRADGSLSADFFLESEVAPKGFFLFRMDVAQGSGLTHLPPFFVSPDGTATGVNNDVESWSDANALHINEVRYEQYFAGDQLRTTLGQIDLTSYFDGNEFANKETFQFIASIFNNDIAVDWGGNVNFFGPGFVLNYHPIEWIEMTVGAFEGDGNYQDLFDHPFVAAEVKLEPKMEKREGHYRFGAWVRATPHPLILDPNRDRSKNGGFGISLDQELTERLGVWIRFGTQDGRVARFDRHLSGGVQWKGLFGRAGDIVGAASGVTFPSRDYKKASGLRQNEYYTEVYYNALIAPNVNVSPDLQYIVHPGADGAVNDIYVYGLRAQINF